MPATYFVIAADGKEYGPVDGDELQNWKNQNRVVPDTQIRIASNGVVVLAKTIPGLFPPPANHLANSDVFTYLIPKGGSIFGPSQQTISQRGDLMIFGLVILACLGSIVVLVSPGRSRHSIKFMIAPFLFSIVLIAQKSKYGYWALGISTLALIAGFVLKSILPAH